MQESLNVSVFGAGYVGLVTACGLASIGHKVVCVDVSTERIASLSRGVVPFFEPGLEELLQNVQVAGRLSFSTSIELAVAHANILILAVGTPPLLDGSADLSQVVAVSRSIGELISKFSVVVVKSTVPVGTSELVRASIGEGLKHRGSDQEFAVASNPEFLKEGDAVRDFLFPDRIVVGASDSRALDLLHVLYQPLCSNANTLMTMSEESSELCKYASNAMLATRISFMNEMARLADATGADIDDVRKVMASDPRIGSKYLNPGAGFGGSCFPKDLKAIVAMGESQGLPMSLVRSVVDVNDAQQGILIEKAIQLLGSLKGKRCAIWGLAFKPNTDDIREAPALSLIRALLAAGASVAAHDPVVEWLSIYSSLPTEIFTIERDEYETTRGADILFLVTEWSNYFDLDLDKLRQTMSNVAIVDGRNIWSKIMFADSDKYIGIGRSGQSGKFIEKADLTIAS